MCRKEPVFAHSYLPMCNKRPFSTHTEPLLSPSPHQLLTQNTLFMHKLPHQKHTRHAGTHSTTSTCYACSSSRRQPHTKKGAASKATPSAFLLILKIKPER